MNLLIDESVDRQIVEKLRQDGHDVMYVSDLGPGIPDDEVLSIANNNQALLVTSDKGLRRARFQATTSLMLESC
jgi:predicted nuclease of predicted toxin-antitoxin system